MKLSIDRKIRLRHIIFFLYFENKHDPKPAKIHERITNVYGDNFCSLNNDNFCSLNNWIKKFNDDYSFKDKLRSGRPTKIDKDHLNNSLNENSLQTTRELAEKFECSKSSIHYHLKKTWDDSKIKCRRSLRTNPNQKKKSRNLQKSIASPQTNIWLLQEISSPNHHL